MSDQPSGRAASGARILGDDVQHLIVWCAVLRALQKNTKIKEIAVEAADSGNVDDLTIKMQGDLADEYWQIKASVDARSPLDEGYLMKTNTKQKTSVLQKLYASWLKLNASGKKMQPAFTLATTKAIRDNDPVLSKRATTDGRIYEPLKADETSRKRWATHVNATEEDLLSFADHLQIRHGQMAKEWEEKAQDLAAIVHVQADAKGLALGLQQVRNWVKAPRQAFTPKQLHEIVDQLQLRLPDETAKIVIQMLDKNPLAGTAEESLDFVNLFDGTNPQNRRKLKDPVDEEYIKQKLGEVRDSLISKGLLQAEVTGPMRLPLWFLAGNVLGNTAGMVVSGHTSQGVWSSASQPLTNAGLVTSQPSSQPQSNQPLAVSINLATDITGDVRSYLTKQNLDIPHVAITLDKAGSRGITSDAHMQAIAFALRDIVRKLDREYEPSVIHLFLAMPGPAALLIGHIWDRMPPTTTYWDMGRPGSYAVAFQVP